MSLPPPPPRLPPLAAAPPDSLAEGLPSATAPVPCVKGSTPDGSKRCLLSATVADGPSLPHYFCHVGLGISSHLTSHLISSHLISSRTCKRGLGEAGGATL